MKYFHLSENQLSFKNNYPENNSPLGSLITVNLSNIYAFIICSGKEGEPGFVDIIFLRSDSHLSLFCNKEMEKEVEEVSDKLGYVKFERKERVIRTPMNDPLGAFSFMAEHVPTGKTLPLYINPGEIELVGETEEGLGIINSPGIAMSLTATAEKVREALGIEVPDDF